MRQWPVEQTTLISRKWRIACFKSCCVWFISLENLASGLKIKTFVEGIALCNNFSQNLPVCASAACSVPADSGFFCAVFNLGAAFQPCSFMFSIFEHFLKQQPEKRLKHGVLWKCSDFHITAVQFKKTGVSDVWRISLSFNNIYSNIFVWLLLVGWFIMSNYGAVIIQLLDVLFDMSNCAAILLLILKETQTWGHAISAGILTGHHL